MPSECDKNVFYFIVFRHCVSSLHSAHQKNGMWNIERVMFAVPIIIWKIMYMLCFIQMASNRQPTTDNRPRETETERDKKARDRLFKMKLFSGQHEYHDVLLMLWLLFLLCDIRESSQKLNTSNENVYFICIFTMDKMHNEKCREDGIMSI